MKHLKLLVNEMNETDDEICLCLHNFSELQIHFLLFPWEIVFLNISGNYLMIMISYLYSAFSI